MHSFRDHHTIEILKLYSSQNKPLDLVIRLYLKNHKAIGSKDRNAICKKIYYLIRNLSLIDFLIPTPVTWEKRVYLLNDFSESKLPDMPEHIRYSMPSWLYKLLKNQYAVEDLNKILSVCNQEAPITIRANTAKVTRDELFSILEKEFKVEKTPLSPLGIRFSKREPLTSHHLFKEGFFEIQDEASQLACLNCLAKPTDHILDYCAGAGGKALAIAPELKGKGTIYVHDIRSQAISEARSRFKRSGIQNAQFFDKEHPLDHKFFNKMDWVIVDAPCTGTGTLRRNPDLKWKLTQENLSNLIIQQREIFEKALRFLKPSGKIIYSTCSILEEENNKQVDYFIQTFGLQRVHDDLVLLPQENGHDGFYAATLQLADKVRK